MEPNDDNEMPHSRRPNNDNEMPQSRRPNNDNEMLQTKRHNDNETMQTKRSNDNEMPQSKRPKLEPVGSAHESQLDGDFVIAEDSFKRSHPVYTLVHSERQQLPPFHKWSPTDDLLLKNAVERYLLPEEIIEQIKFNARFSTLEIMERWKALLYDAAIAEYVNATVYYQ